MTGLAVEFNSCAGGMAEGFRRAGVQFDVAIDFDSNACDSYERNHGHRPEQMDLRDLLADVLEAGGGQSVPMFFGGPLWLLVADPPCTPWSRAGKRLGVADERDMLGVTCELIRLLRPSAYLIGNVPGLDDSTQWRHVQAALAPLLKAGYCIADYASLDAADFGVPQHRVRPFWFGHLAGPCLRWPLPTHGDPEAQKHALPGLALKPWVTCRDALQHLPVELLGRPVHLRRDREQVARPNGGHPPSAPSAPARTLHGEGGRAGRPEGVLAFDLPGHQPMEPDAPAKVITTTHETKARAENVLAVHEFHKPSVADEPSKTIPAYQHTVGGEVLEGWPWDRPSTSILRDPRIPPPGHHSTGSFLSPPEARGSRKRGPPQSERLGEADRPSETIDARPARSGIGPGQVKAWPWDRPSTVVDSRPELAPFGRDGRGRNGEPEHQRSHPNAVVLSERAAAILQGFPETWHFAGKTKKARWSQIGQAMPPPLAEAVARSVIQQREGTLARPAEASHG